MAPWYNSPEKRAEAVRSAKENAELIGVEFNAAYVAYWMSCSERFARQSMHCAGMSA